ncbi:MAG: peptidylprolyl isomerase [Methanobacteriota archaeon]
MASDAISKGDIVWIEYDGWTVNPNGTLSLFDTTHQEVAKKEGKFEEKKVYQEVPVIVGHARLFAGLDEALLGSRLGDAKEITIPSEKGAGARDPRLVELKTEREFLRQEIDPEVGMEVSIGGRRGTVTAAAAGRVRVDFNNPLAGRTLKYSFRVVRKAMTPEERVRALIDLGYGLAEQFAIDIQGDRADIRLPDISKTDEKWFVSKFRVVADLRELTNLRVIRFVEEYERKAEPKPAEAPKEEPGPAEEVAKEAGAEAKTPPEGKPKARKATRRPAKAKESPPAKPKEEKAPEEL